VTSWGDEVACTHADNLPPVEPSGSGCKECLATGGTWVHLRLCLHCGHVGCCDQSPGRHATAHYREQEHPVVQSFEPNEDWRWCYADEVYG
jgi:uncharacterized UBP type Zn finger protein